MSDLIVQAQRSFWPIDTEINLHLTEGSYTAQLVTYYYFAVLLIKVIVLL